MHWFRNGGRGGVHSSPGRVVRVTRDAGIAEAAVDGSGRQPFWAEKEVGLGLGLAG